MIKPTAREFDKLLTKYAGLQAEAQVAATAAGEKKAAADVLKLEVVELVKTFGAKSSEASMRFKGERCTATVTIGRMTKINDAAVDELRGYLDKSEIEGLSERFFSPVTTYKLVDSPAQAVKSLKGTPPRVWAKIKALADACFEVVTKSPLLKVDVPETAKA
jgi:hypothetical protein